MGEIMSGHTQGPWEALRDWDTDGFGNYTQEVQNANGDCIAIVHGKDKVTCQSNGELLAAAPEMFEALESIRTLSAYMNSSGNRMVALGTIWAKAEAALKKARGGQ